MLPILYYGAYWVHSIVPILLPGPKFCPTLTQIPFEGAAKQNGHNGLYPACPGKEWFS